MRTQTFALLASAAALLAACGKDQNGDLVIKKPDIHVSTSEDTVKTPTITTEKREVSTPVVGTQKETLIVNKPVVGTEKKTVSVPVIKRP